MGILLVIGTIFFLVLFQYLTCFSIFVIIKLSYYSFRRCQYNIRLFLDEQFSLIIFADILFHLIKIVIDVNILISWLNTSEITICINLLLLYIFYIYNNDYLLNIFD
jgi:hypothetical protein